MTSSATRSCQVVPSIPAFSVDDGFRYRVPDGLTVSVGHRVRIRVGGRRIRGHVTATFDEPQAPERRLVDIDGIVGTVPSFHSEDLELLRWCAGYYVGPLSVILDRTTPPNVPRSTRPAPGRRPGTGQRLTSIVGGAPHGPQVADILRDRPGGSAMVIAPSVEEVEAIADHLGAHLAGTTVVVAHSSLPAKEATAAWTAAALGTDVVLVGTREVALWPMPDLGSIVVVEDGRRVMRSPSTPTVGVREVALRRASLRAVPITFLAPVPTLEVLRRQPVLIRPPGREWPLVEVADRNEEPPSSSVVLDRTRRAITGAAAAGPVFVLVPRRGYAAAFRCATCGTVRTCTSCGAAVTADAACRRCGAPTGPCPTCGGASWRPLGAGIGVVVDDLRRSLGPDVDGPTGTATVTVGTERDLIGRTGLVLAVAIDVDGLALAPNYRAAEHGLATLVRLARTVARGRGHRTLIQTSDPEQPIVRTLVSGRAEAFLADELGRRQAAGFPPFTELLAVEVSDLDDPARLPDLADELGLTATVRGPAQEASHVRWLVSARDLGPAKLALRRIVGSLRDQGARVRVDVDPIDL